MWSTPRLAVTLSIVAILLGSFPAASTAQTLSVTPDGTWSGTVLTSTTGNTAVFSLTYAGWKEFDLTCSTTLGLSCTVQSPVFVHNTVQVTVYFDTSTSTGTAQVRLDAYDGPYGADTGYRTYTVSSGIEVAAQSVPSSVTQYAQDATASYWVKNTTGSQKTITMSCIWGGASCSVNPESPTVSNNDSVSVTTTFDGGGTVTSHTLRLDAVSGGLSAYHSQSVSVTEFLSVNSVATRNPVYVAPNTSMTDTFAVRFPGQSASTFNLVDTCTGLTGCDVASSASVGDTEVLVPVTYTSGSNGTTGTFTLTATKSGNSAITAQGTLDVVATNEILLGLESANAGLEEVRSDCITIAAGPGAIQCDDFVYYYGFTPVTRMNTSRQIGLFYNSARRQPQYAIGANVVLPPGVSKPDIHAELKQLPGGTRLDSLTYDSSLFETGENTRIAFNGLLTDTGDEPVTYAVELSWTGGPSGSPVADTAQFLQVDTRSEFGRGWWLAGLERLTIVGDSVRMWVGGDGSARAYLLASDSTWIGQTRTRADTITSDANYYYRELIGGGTVYFNKAGRHVKTISRTGIETRFNWGTVNGATRLTNIQIEKPGGSFDTVFQFSYDASANVLLSQVKVLSKTGSWDTFDINQTAAGSYGRIDSIESPDSRLTEFSYDTSGGLLETVTVDMSASVTQVTTIAYDGTKVESVTVAATGESSIVTQYEPYSLIGTDGSGWPPRPVEEVYALLDGPRDTTDVTRFYPTAWGGLRGIRDAYDDETWIDYEDASFPSHPTRVRHPNGWEVTASYYSSGASKGLLEEVIDRSTGSVTSYEWNTTWSRPSAITSAEGIVTNYHYDGSGNLDTLTVSGTTLVYSYNTQNQVDSIIDGEGNETVLAYDGTYGNLQSETDPLGNQTSYARDSRGYVVAVTMPIGTASYVRIDSVYHDVVGRDSVLIRKNTQDSTWLKTTHTYDTYSGLLTQTEAIGSGESPTDTVTTGASSWIYDGFGRVVVEANPSATDTLQYDASGNVITRIRSSDAVSLEYDLMNRLLHQVVPEKSWQYGAGELSNDTTWYFPYYEEAGLTIRADTATFEYDEMGNILSADNWRSRISRSYYLNGLVRTESDSMAEYNDSTDFSTHVYDLAYDYDLDGNRVAVHHPSWLSGGSDRTDYRYDDGSGRLESVVDALGNEYGFVYDGNGQVISERFPGFGLDSMSYDGAGRLIYRVVTTDGDTLYGETIEYTKDGRVQYAGSAEISYDGFGSLIWGASLVQDYTGQVPDITDTFERDAFGNALLSRQDVACPGCPGTVADSLGTRVGDFPDGWGGQLHTSTEQWGQGGGTPPVGWEPGGTLYIYANGNQTMMWGSSYAWDYFGGMEGFDYADLEAEHRTEAHSYYAADQTLRYYQINRDSLDHTVWPPTVEGAWGSYEEFWYDALGRRILKRTRQESPLCTINGTEDRCHSAIERYVWDGSQLLWELRQANAGDTKNPGGGAQSGTIGYVHASGIDAPLGMIHNGSAIALHRNWRGLHAFATDDEGNSTTCAPTVFAGCTPYPWPAWYWDPNLAGVGTKALPIWYGSLPADNQDRTGLRYQRNRYYDSRAGQFTQQDPIGIAGGLNLYGYANGDPVNFSDPFGLCPPEDDNEDDCPAPEEEEEEPPLTRAQLRALGGVDDCPTCAWRADNAAQFARENPRAALTIGLVGTGGMAAWGLGAAMGTAGTALSYSTSPLTTGGVSVAEAEQYFLGQLTRGGAELYTRLRPIVNDGEALYIMRDIARNLRIPFPY